MNKLCGSTANTWAMLGAMSCPETTARTHYTPRSTDLRRTTMLTSYDFPSLGSWGMGMM